MVETACKRSQCCVIFVTAFIVPRVRDCEDGDGNPVTQNEQELGFSAEFDSEGEV
jgi:hypothetical protein